MRTTIWLRTDKKRTRSLSDLKNTLVVFIALKCDQRRDKITVNIELTPNVRQPLRPRNAEARMLSTHTPVRG